MNTEITAHAPMTAFYLNRLGVTLYSVRAMGLADAVAYGSLYAIDEIIVISRLSGDKRLARLANRMGYLYERGAFDPLAPLSDKEIWKAIDDACWQIEANAEVVSTFFTEEV